MNKKTSSLLLGAAIAGLVGATSIPTPALAAHKSEMGLCKGANSCSGKSACGELKGKNNCKGEGYAMMSKSRCERKHHHWMPAPKMQ